MRRLAFLVVLASASACASAPAPTPEPAPTPIAAAVPVPVPVPEPGPEPVSDPVFEPEPEQQPTMAATPGYAPNGTDVLLVQEVLRAVDDIVRVMESTEDCERMVDGLELVVVRIRPLLSRAKEIEKQKARSEWFKQQLEAPITATANRMITPFQRCAQNKRLLALMQSLGS
ncbi:MAG TPA: hypothetical protein VMZ28_26695 [Kofleriaceae bacterium]|nr:hypothetical protein [Kofleriaceae bacterium]